MALPDTGIGEAFFFTPEATFNTGIAISATDAVSPTEFKFTPEQEWLESEAYSGSASLQTEIEGLRGGSWEGSFEFRPVASATQPDIGALLQSAGFSYLSDVYSLSAGDAASMQAARMIHVRQEIVNGLWTEEIDFNVEGNGIPMIAAKGRFASHGHSLGTITLASGAGTTLVLNAANAWQVTPGARLTVNGDDNSGDGFLVTAVASDGVTLTVGSTLPGVSSGQSVIPTIPSTTTAGSPLGAIACSMSVGGTSVGFIDFKLNYKSGISGLDQEASSDRATQVVRGMRKVEGSAKFYLLEENAGFLGGAWDGTVQSISCRVGDDVTGRRVTIAMPAARLGVAELETTFGEATVYEMSFKARQSVVANDELTLTWD